MKLGKLQKDALRFYTKINDWHTFNQDSTTKRTLKSLAQKGLLEIVGDMAKITQKGKVENV